MSTEITQSTSRPTLVSRAPSADHPQVWNLFAVLLPAVFPALAIVIAVGTWLGLARAEGGSSQQWLGTWLTIAAPIAFWLLLVYVTARSRFRSLLIPANGRVLLLAAIGLFLLTRLPNLPQLLQAIPLSWLIGVQVVRVVGGVFLLVWLSREVRQSWFNLEAGSLDLLVGATALPVAWWVASASPVALAAGVVWNVVGLLDFVLAVAIGRIVKGAGPGYVVSQNTRVVSALRPTILGILAFGVPLAIILHLLSLWQLLVS